MTHSTYGRATCAILAAMMAVAPASLRAQVQQQGSSVIDDLLTRAQNSLDDLKYSQALVLAKQVLDLGDRVAPDRLERAMFIVAAANYPEGEPASQHRSVALEMLKQMVRTKLDLTIPQAIRWAGLDSILAEAKATTFGLAASPTAGEQDAVGPAGHVDFAVRSNRPARFRLSITGSGTPAVLTDSSGGTESTIQIPTMKNDRPAFATGQYQIVVTAIDIGTGDTVSTQFTANVTVPELTFATVPVTIDSSKFLPERTRKYGWKGIVVGGLVAGSIFSFSTMHADTTLKAKVGADSKGAGIAVLAGATVVLASFLDKGRTIPSAVAANERTRQDFAASIRAAQAENVNRIATHKTTFVITSGAR